MQRISSRAHPRRRGVIRARHNDLALGTDPLSAGEPEWDSR